MSGFPEGTSMAEALQEALEGCLEDFKGRQKIELLADLYKRLGIPSSETDCLLLITGNTYWHVENVLKKYIDYQQHGAMKIGLRRSKGSSFIDTVKDVVGSEQMNIEVAYFMKNTRDGRYTE